MSIPPRPALFQPVNLGFTFSTPFNLANVLSQDIAGPIAIALAGIFGFVILAGAIILPFASWKGFRLERVSKRRRKRNVFIDEDSSLNNILEQLDIAESLHLLENQQEDCHKKIICEVHSTLLRAPKQVKIVYGFFSRRMKITKFEEAIKQGLRGDECQSIYSSCRASMGELLAGMSPLKEFLHFVRKHSPYFSNNP